MAKKQQPTLLEIKGINKYLDKIMQRLNKKVEDEEIKKIEKQIKTL